MSVSGLPSPMESSPLPEGIAKYNADDHSFSLSDGSKVFVRDFQLGGKALGKEDFTPEVQLAAAEVLKKTLDHQPDFEEVQVKVKVSSETSTASYTVGETEHSFTYDSPIYEKMRTIMQTLRNLEEGTGTSASPTASAAMPAPSLSAFARLKMKVASLFQKSESHEPPSVEVSKVKVPTKDKLEAEKKKLEEEIRQAEKKLKNPTARGKINQGALAKIEKERSLVDSEAEKIQHLGVKLSAEEKRLHEELPQLSPKEGQAKINAYLEKYKNLRLMEAMNANKWAALNIREALAKGMMPRTYAPQRYDTEFEASVGEKVQEKRNILESRIKAPLEEEGGVKEKEDAYHFTPLALPDSDPQVSSTSGPQSAQAAAELSTLTKLAQRIRDYIVSLFSSKMPVEEEKEEVKVAVDEKEVAGAEPDVELDAGAEVEMQETGSLPASFRLDQIFRHNDEADQVEAMRKYIKHATVGPKGKKGNPEDLQKLFVKLGSDLKGNEAALDILRKALTASFDKEFLGAYVTREGELATVIKELFETPMPEGSEAQYGRMMFMNEFLGAAIGKRKEILASRLEEIGKSQEAGSKALVADLRKQQDALEKEIRAYQTTFGAQYDKAVKEKNSVEAGRLLEEFREKRTDQITRKIELTNKMAFLATRGKALKGQRMEVDKPPISMFVANPKASVEFELLEKEIMQRGSQMATEI